MAHFSDHEIQESFTRRQRADNQRQQLAEQIRVLGKRQADWNGEDRRTWDALTLKYDEMDVADRRHKSRIGRDGATVEGGPVNREFFGGDNGGSTLDRAITAWTMNALGKRVRPSDADACADYGISLNANAFEVRLPVHGPMTGLQRLQVANALSTGIGSGGGFTVPQGFVPRLERALLSFAGTMQAAEIMTTDSGIDLPWPTCNDTNNVGALIGEDVAAGDTGQDPKFGAVVFQAFIFTSNVVRVPTALLEDTGVDLAGALGDMLGERIGRALNPYLTTGTGGGQPSGIITGSTLGVTAGSPTAIGFDDLINLVGSIDPAYVGPDAGFMMHNSIMTVVKTLKDGVGRYLWQPSTQAGQPPTLLGHPVFLNQAMDSTVASGKKTVLFGLLNKYKVRRVGVEGGGVRLLKLVERYAEYDQTGFIAFARFDGAMLDAGTHPCKFLQH